ncbi:MAG: HmuY family protein [Bacteroidota bacterium]
MRKIYQIALYALAFVTLAACDSNSDDDPEPLQASLIQDIAADPTVGRDPVTGRPISLNQYAFVSLRDGNIVLTYDNTTRTDSASTNWDIAFQGTNIIFNGGNSGPGQGGAVILEQTFEEVIEAPADSEFRTDGVSVCSTDMGDGAAFAVCPGSDNGWYNYNPASNLVSPLAGRTIAVRTADGRFAKFRILSYYQGNPAITDVTATTPSRFYTIEYVFRADGSRNLESL